MDIADLRARLSSRSVDGTVPQRPADALAPAANTPAAEGLEDGPLIAAAVLVPILHGAHPGIMLTKRTTTLSTHAGQVAFPGGRMEPGESAEAAALREAMEEVGLPAHWVELTGRLPDRVTGTGFCITPVLGLIAPGFIPVPAAAEVEEVFTFPLQTLLDPAAPQRQRAFLKGRQREFWVWPHHQHHIWGATASILVELANRLRAAEGG